MTPHYPVPPIPPEARCIVCGRPIIDHTRRHPGTMIRHLILALLP